MPGGRTDSAGDKVPPPTPQEALAVLRDRLKSPRAQAAIKTLESELGGHDNSKSSGSQHGFPSKADVAARFGGSASAKGQPQP